MVAKRSTKMGKLAPYVDVRSPSDIPKFESMIKMGPVFVLVYADWCGHCKRFKDAMWDDVANSSKKAVNTAAVHYDMVEKTSMKNTPIEGYPTLFEVKTTPKSNVSKPVPTPKTKEELETLVGVNTPVSAATNVTPMNNNIARSERMITNSNTAMIDTFEPEPAESLPPAPEMNTDEPDMFLSGSQPGSQRGGSLMESLLRISADSAHAIVLAGSAAELSNRWKKRHTKRRRSGKKKQTRRR
jgi:thiol-disulfide isomerase/thioredoxin